MPLPGILFASFAALLVVAIALVVVNAVRRKRQGDARIEKQGWRRLPDDAGVVAGWDGWPFLVARRPGRATDVVVGELEGVEFMSLRWSQHETGRGAGSGDDIERYNIVALRCETPLPHVSVVRGEHAVRRPDQHGGAAAFDVGDRRFDGRWLLLGDPEVGRALLVPEVRTVMDDLGVGAWVLQPGWVVRVTRWTFWAGDDGMLEELHRAAAPWRAVPTETWRTLGGVPRFTTALGGPGRGETPTTGPGRGRD